MKGHDFDQDKKWEKHLAVDVFVDCIDQVLYIGRTVEDLKIALNRIKVGHESQLTNHRLHIQLNEQLKKPLSVEILAYTNVKAQTDLAEFFDKFKSKLFHHTRPLWNLP